MVETYEVLYARISKFEAALRKAAMEHGFYVARVQMDDDRRDFDLEMTVDFVMTDGRGRPARGPGLSVATHETTIRLEEGRS